MNTKALLEDVKNGKISVDEALLKIKLSPFEDIGFAKVDLHRKVRQGVPEVIYGAGKTAEQIIKIIDVMIKNEQKSIIITRIDKQTPDIISKKHNIA